MPALLWIVLVSPPDAGAGPVPAWQPLGGGPITTSTDDQLGGAAWHEGQLYTVIETYHQADAEAAASEPVVLDDGNLYVWQYEERHHVWIRMRYDPSLNCWLRVGAPQRHPPRTESPREVAVWRYDTSIRAWVRVGGTLNADLRDAVGSPTLASAGGRLYVAFNERQHDRWRVVVRRLEEVRGLVRWEAVDTPAATSLSSPVLAAVGATVWLAWTEPAPGAPAVRVARLQADGRWAGVAREIPVDDDRMDIRMVGTPTGAYLSILEPGLNRLRIQALTETDAHVLLDRQDHGEAIEHVAMTVLTMRSGPPRLFVAYAAIGRVRTLRTSVFGDVLVPVVDVPAPGPARIVGIDVAIVGGAPHLAMLMLQPQPGRPELALAATVGRLAWDEPTARIEPLATQPLGDLRLTEPHLLQNQTGRPLLGVGLNRGGRQHAAMLVYNAEPASH